MLEIPAGFLASHQHLSCAVVEVFKSNHHVYSLFCKRPLYKGPLENPMVGDRGPDTTSPVKLYLLIKEGEEGIPHEVRKQLLSFTTVQISVNPYDQPKYT